MKTVDDFILDYGNSAYEKAVEFVAIATRLNDIEGQKHFAEVARELLQRGYRRDPSINR